MGRGARLATFAALLAACVAGGLAAIVLGAGTEKSASDEGGAAALEARRAEGQPVVVFRTVDANAQITEGQLAFAPLDSPAGEPTPLPVRCDRVYFDGGRGLCLARGRGFAAGYRARIFDSRLRVRHEIEMAGVPSRARVSPDGRLGSVTFFVSGHSYAEAGAFSTQTTLIDLAKGEPIADLEDFAVLRNGRQLTAVDMNFWGVTFAPDGDRFYATLATGGKTYLIEGSIGKRSARVIHENVECPSLSPDGTRVAYKQRTRSRKNPWRLSVLDLETGRETRLAEAATVDDQAEWLDETHVLYGIAGEVRVVSADGSGTPRRFVGRAASPAVVRW